jgi:hypothetical protein
MLNGHAYIEVGGLCKHGKELILAIMSFVAACLLGFLDQYNLIPS